MVDVTAKQRSRKGSRQCTVPKAILATIFIFVFVILCKKDEKVPPSFEPKAQGKDSGSTPKAKARTTVKKEKTNSPTITIPSSKAPLFHIIFSTGDDTLSTLNMRCIESIFFFHPQARLHIHTNKDTGISGKSHPKLQPLLEEGYNITFVRYRPQDVLRAVMDDVPRADGRSSSSSSSRVDKKAANAFLSQISKLRKEKYWYSNETNLLRMCLLYLQGGIYLDTDVILINPVLANDDRIDNVMARNDKKFHCAVMKFTKPGNRFLAAAISNFLNNYNGTVWGNNGPKAFGRTAQEHPELVCPDDHYDYINNVTTDNNLGGGMTTARTATKNQSTCWLNPIPNEAFAPISWKKWDEVCFSDQSPLHENAKSLTAKSYAVHLNNRKTGGKLQAKEYRKGSLCDLILSSFCVLCQ